MADVSGSLQVRGLKELDEAMRKLPVEVAGPITLAALRAGGELIRSAAAANVDSRTGRTAADIRVEVQIQSEERRGVAAVGGTTGKQGRAHVLRWLEFGAAPHKIVAGASERREARRAARALTRIGEVGAARALRRGVRTGAIKVRRALALPGGRFRASVNHPGIRPEAPLTRALGDNIQRVIKTVQESLWSGIAATTKSFPKAE